MLMNAFYAENSDNNVESVDSVHARVKQLVDWAEENIHVDSMLRFSSVLFYFIFSLIITRYIVGFTRRYTTNQPVLL